MDVRLAWKKKSNTPSTCLFRYQGKRLLSESSPRPCSKTHAYTHTHIYICIYSCFLPSQQSLSHTVYNTSQPHGPPLRPLVGAKAPTSIPCQTFSFLLLLLPPELGLHNKIRQDCVKSLPGPRQSPQSSTENLLFSLLPLLFIAAHPDDHSISLPRPTNYCTD